MNVVEEEQRGYTFLNNSHPTVKSLSLSPETSVPNLQDNFK